MLILHQNFRRSIWVAFYFSLYNFFIVRKPYTKIINLWFCLDFVSKRMNEVFATKLWMLWFKLLGDWATIICFGHLNHWYTKFCSCTTQGSVFSLWVTSALVYVCGPDRVHIWDCWIVVASFVSQQSPLIWVLIRTVSAKRFKWVLIF